MARQIELSSELGRSLRILEEVFRARRRGVVEAETYGVGVRVFEYDISVTAGT